MREIVLVNSKPFRDIKTLVVNEIVHFPLHSALIEAHISPVNPKRDIQALIFTSKHAIKALAKEIDSRPQMSEFYQIPSFVIGAGSAQSLQKYNFTLEYISPDSHGEGFANELVEKLKGKNALYIRAKKIVSRLDERLSEAKVSLKQVIAYENKTKILPQELKPTPRSIVIFTAPSNYYSFVQNFGWDGSYVAIAIGMTTFGVLAKEITRYVAPKQSIESCVEFAQEIAHIYP